MRKVRLYEDGDNSYADELRYKPSTKPMVEFFGHSNPLNADNLSSIVSSSIETQFYRVSLDELDGDEDGVEFQNLKARLAHGSKVPCDKITSRIKVLCIYKKDNGRKEYCIHQAGKCPHILAFIERYKL
jgi:hypothetical protein